MARHIDLTADALAELGRPFTPAAVKFKPVTKAQRDGKGMIAMYIDARLVAERLNYVVGAEGWEDRYEPLLHTGAEMATHYFPVECALTVLGVTKSDVGCYQRSSADDLAWKAAYSDSFKRVAVKFRVGAFLYAIPKMRAELKVVNDKVVGIADDGMVKLNAGYERWLRNGDLNAFGDPLDHGDVALPDEEAAGEAGATT